MVKTSLLTFKSSNEMQKKVYLNERGMVVSARQGGLSISENANPMVREEWPEWFEMTEKQQ